MINGINGSSAARLGGLIGGTGPAGSVSRLVDPRQDNSSALTTSARMVADGAPIDTDRVAALRAAIKAGSYGSDPAAIAGKMIAADLGAKS